MPNSVSELLGRNEHHAREFDNERFEAVQDGQAPPFLTVCCSDSRVLQDELFENRTPGNVFTVGAIGNRVFEETAEGLTVSGDVLYPLVHADTETVVVIGHTGCGAVTATYRDIQDEIEETAGIRHCIDLLKPRLADGVAALPEELDEAAAINHLVEYNVDQQVAFLRESDDVPDIDVVGVVYDFQDVYTDERGLVHVVNVDGVRDPERIRTENPEIAERVQRLWTY